MKLKSNPVEGVCAAARCAQPSIENGLCAKHGSKPSTDLDTVRAEIEPLRARIESVLAYVSTVALDRQETIDQLGQIREVARKQIVNLEERRTSITRPMLEAKRAADREFKPAIESCEAVMRCVTARLEEFNTARRAAQDVALESVALGARDENTLLVAHGAGALSLPETVREQTEWTFEVVELALVPGAYLMLDERAVRAAIRDSRGQIEIPGIRIVQRTAVRTK